jgi:hypothetical protein
MKIMCTKIFLPNHVYERKTEDVFITHLSTKTKLLHFSLGVYLQNHGIFSKSGKGTTQPYSYVCIESRIGISEFETD